MRNPLRLIALTFLVGASLIYSMYPLRCEIRSPRIGVPAIQKAGSMLSVEIKHSLPYALGAWRFELKPDFGDSLALTPVSKITGFSQSQFNLQLPSNLARGGYDLNVYYGDSVKTASHSLYVLDHFNRDLKLVQLADLPTLGNAKGDGQLIKIIDEINIINPDLVLFTGDVAYGASWGQYRRLYQILQQLQVPLILAPGNHEYYGWAGYLTLFGKPYHAVQYGDYRIISLNSGHGRDQFTYSQIKWLRRQLEGSEQSQRIVQLHHPVHHRADLSGYLRGNVRSFVDLIKRHKVSVVLSGHWHGDSLYNEDGEDITDSWRVKGTPYVVTTTAGADFRPTYSNSPLHYGYRLLRYRDAELENFTYDYDGDGVRDAASSIPFNHLNVSKLDAHRFKISNTLNEGFKSALVHVRVDDASATQLCPSVGQVARQQRQAQAVDYWIRLDIPAQREIELSLSKQDSCA